MRLAPQVERAHYGHGYDDAARVVLHDAVLREVRAVAPRRVLEIGVGSGHVTRALRRDGAHVTTFDIAADLAPDVRGSVTHLPFGRGAFDVAVAEEVLEHVPWDAAQRAMRDLVRVATRRVVVSVPQFGVATRLRLAVTRAAHGLRGGQHYWTLGSREVSPGRFKRALRAAGLVLDVDRGVVPLRPVPFARDRLARAYPSSAALRAFAAWRLVAGTPAPRPLRAGDAGNPR